MFHRFTKKIERSARANVLPSWLPFEFKDKGREKRVQYQLGTKSALKEGFQAESKMSKTELLVRLRDLHEELAGINEDIKTNHQIDDETIDALGQLVTDVGTLADRSKELNASAEVQTDEHTDLRDRVLKFDAYHPRVADFLSQLSEVLAMLGI